MLTLLQTTINRLIMNEILGEQEICLL